MAVTQTDGLRLRIEIDAICVCLYGLTADDFEWIVRDDPVDPKGFYRVDRKPGFVERLTGLAAAAFRGLKDGKWSASTAARSLSDEFFDEHRHPRDDQRKAAKALGLPEAADLQAEGLPQVGTRDVHQRRPPLRLDLGRLQEGRRCTSCPGSGGAVREAYIEGKIDPPKAAIGGSSPSSAIMEVEAPIFRCDPVHEKPRQQRLF